MKLIKRIVSRVSAGAGDLLPMVTSGPDMTSSNHNEIIVEEGGGDEVKEALIDLLVPFIRIGSDSGRVSLTSNFDDLNSKQKILVILFAEKLRAKHLNSSYTDDEYLSPNEISKLSETNLKYLYPDIQELERDDIVDYEEARYRINPDKNVEAQSIIPEAHP